MILTTTNSIEGHKIEGYLGIVTGISVASYGIFSGNIDVIVNKVKEQAFQKLQNNAIKLKANAIVGILVDIEVLDQRYKVIASITGTAVKVI